MTKLLHSVHMPFPFASPLPLCCKTIKRRWKHGNQNINYRDRIQFCIGKVYDNTWLVMTWMDGCFNVQRMTFILLVRDVVTIKMAMTMLNVPKTHIFQFLWHSDCLKVTNTRSARIFECSQVYGARRWEWHAKSLRNACIISGKIFGETVNRKFIARMRLPNDAAHGTRVWVNEGTDFFCVSLCAVSGMPLASWAWVSCFVGICAAFIHYTRLADIIIIIIVCIVVIIKRTTIYGTRSPPFGRKHLEN